MSTLYYESSLAHHGIKGQKWGVRRYQNPDGTLTSAGRVQAKRNSLKRKIGYNALFEGVNKDRYYDDIVIKKGSSAQHIGLKKNIDLKNDRMYISVNEKDNQRYVYNMTRELMNVFGKIPYKHMYETTEDLIIPSKEKMC